METIQPTTAMLGLLAVQTVCVYHFIHTTISSPPHLLLPIICRFHFFVLHWLIQFHTSYNYDVSSELSYFSWLEICMQIFFLCQRYCAVCCSCILYTPNQHPRHTQHTHIHQRSSDWKRINDFFAFGWHDSCNNWFIYSGTQRTANGSRNERMRGVCVCVLVYATFLMPRCNESIKWMMLSLYKTERTSYTRIIIRSNEMAKTYIKYIKSTTWTKKQTFFPQTRACQQNIHRATSNDVSDRT